jgi:hypothetical protein
LGWQFCFVVVVYQKEGYVMNTFSVRCGKCENVKHGNYDDVFQFMAASRVDGWQIPDAQENQPILCSACKAAQNFPTDLGRTPNQP